MLQDIKVQLCALIPMLLICTFSFRKQSIILKNTWVYRQLLLITTSCAFMDLLSIIGILYWPEDVTKIICRLYLWLVLWSGYFTLYYLCYDVKYFRERKKMRALGSTVNGVMTSAVFFLPISISNDKGVLYTYGDAVNFTFVLSAIYIFFCISGTFIFGKLINEYRKSSIRIWMLVELAGAVIQYKDRRLLLVSYTMMVGIFILYARLENLDGWRNRKTGFYTFTMLNEHIKDLFVTNKSASFLVVLGEERRELDVTTVDVMRGEINKFLSDLAEGKIFHGYKGDYILEFPNEAMARESLKLLKERFKKGWTKNHININPTIYMIPSIMIADNAKDLLQLYQSLPERTAGREEMVYIVDESAIEEMHENRHIQDEIGAALKDDRIEVYLQPIYSINDNKFTSAEALVRMIDSEGALIMPGAFIPVAEQCGLIEQIGERVFEKVCSFIKDNSLSQYGIKYLEVNLSVVQCENELLSQRFSQIISKYGIDASTINLELTETMKLNKRNVLYQNMDKLKKVGCSFSLDDFGTGESNLNYIMELPVDFVKFDRSMIISYFENERTKLVLRYVVDMIKNMNMKIVAEGVEDEYQFNSLMDLGVDYIQGFYFSKPIPREEFLQFISRYGENL